eukprot:scaffold26184_cov132-Cylindrotheca_fusiformis.AAC.1
MGRAGKRAESELDWSAGLVFHVSVLRMSRGLTNPNLEKHSRTSHIRTSSVSTMLPSSPLGVECLCGHTYQEKIGK